MRHLTPLLAAAASALITGYACADVGDQLAKLLADDGAAEDRFGTAVAICGAPGARGAPGNEIAIVGAPLHDDNGDNSGAAYLFDTMTGRQIAKLLPDDGAEGDSFGASVAISGTAGNQIAIVGAPLDDDNGDDSGSAYLFDLTTGEQIAKFVADDGTEGDQFGFSVAINGVSVVVGAWKDDENGAGSGSAYLFDCVTGRQIAKLLADDGAEDDQFGHSVAVNIATAIVGASFDDDNGHNSGSVYLFDTITGRLITKLLTDDGMAGDHFGFSVAVSGTTAAFGASQNFNDRNGSAYLFDISTGQQLFKLLADDGDILDHFGWSIAISGTTVIIGAIWAGDLGSHSGAAYFFDTTTGQQIAKLVAKDGAQFQQFGRTVGINGGAAIIGATFDDDNGFHSGSAYLFHAAPCSADVSGDATVGPADLAIILGNWGPAPPNDPAADLNDDGVVGPADLAIVISNWGPCT